jgi:hypothetical protein
MSIADKLGMDMSTPDSTADSITSEDIMEVEISFKYDLGGRWHRTNMKRQELQGLLNTSTPSIDGHSIRQLCLVVFEGEECNLETILTWDVDGSKHWRLV